jgi:hypothetical protein
VCVSQAATGAVYTGSGATGGAYVRLYFRHALLGRTFERRTGGAYVRLYPAYHRRKNISCSCTGRRLRAFVSGGGRITG